MQITKLTFYTSSSYGVLFQSVAVSTTWRQSTRPEAFLHAEESQCSEVSGLPPPNVTVYSQISAKNVCYTE